MDDRRTRIAATGLAALAAALMLYALYSLARARHVQAGLSFLTASLVIYYRETSMG